MFAIIINWWLALLTPPEVNATTTALGGSIDYARMEADYRCSRELADACRSRGLEPPTDVYHGIPDCDERDDGIASCETRCSGECAVQTVESEEQQL